MEGCIFSNLRGLIFIAFNMIIVTLYFSHGVRRLQINHYVRSCPDKRNLGWLGNCFLLIWKQYYLIINDINNIPEPIFCFSLLICYCSFLQFLRLVGCTEAKKYKTVSKDLLIQKSYKEFVTQMYIKAANKNYLKQPNV